MIWLTWRQFRTQAAAVYAAVAAVAVLLAVTGPRLRDLARIDANIFDRLTSGDQDLFYAGIVVVAVAPAVIGAFWGAPLVARELEGGTHRLVWTQSVTRTRWLATKLAVTSLAAAAVVGALTLAVSWWAEPIDGAVSSTHGGLPARLTPVSFAMRGVVPVGYAVFAVVLGVVLGALVRRSLPAMALTLALFVVVQIAVPTWIRPHLAASVREDAAFTMARFDGYMSNGPGIPGKLSLNTGGQGNWVLSNQTVDASGRATALPSWFTGCLPPPPAVGQDGPVRVQGPDPMAACFQRLNAEGYHQHIVYQPAKNFWPLQWAELALYLALSGLLAGFCFWWVRRRLS
jgi:hypothetical protein